MSLQLGCIITWNFRSDIFYKMRKRLNQLLIEYLSMHFASYNNYKQVNYIRLDNISFFKPYNFIRYRMICVFGSAEKLKF